MPSSSSFDAPKLLSMVRAMDRSLSEAEAKEYAKSLPPEQRMAVQGCYCVHCVRPCSCPIAATYNCTENWTFFPCITIPFGCCVCINGSESEGFYTNVKGDTVIVKVDQENETLACFTHNCGGPNFYCKKM